MSSTLSQTASLGRLCALRAQTEAEYRQRTPRSRAFFKRSNEALVGGTTGNLRYFAPYPIYFVAADGACMTDLDGNRYVDCFMCNGPMLLGHRHPDVTAAIDDHKAAGSLVVNPPLATEVAEAIKDVVPCAERVRLLNSGTEAALTAVRYARAFTGRQQVIKFLGHYHGQDDQFLLGISPTGEAFGQGVSHCATRNTQLIEYGDIAALEAQIASNPDVAAVILDPAMHSGALSGSDPEYLAAVRELTAQRGIVLIFDEVITGFRLALGGAQTYYGVIPDLVVLGKALANGEKLAAVAGREEVMRVVDPSGAPSAGVFQSGTVNDGTSALAAALASISAYRRLDATGEYERLFHRAERLADGIRAAFAAHKCPLIVRQLGPMMQIFLTDVLETFECLSTVDPAARQTFLLALINEGLLLTLPTSDHIYLSFAHQDHHIDEAIVAVETVLGREGSWTAALSS